MKELLLFIFTIIAYFVKAITGFGDTLVMTSLFSLIVSNNVTTPVNLLISFPTNVYITYRERKNLSLRIIIPSAITLFIGIIPGTFLLTHLTNWIIKVVLGFVVITIAIGMLTKNSDQKSKKANAMTAVTVGILSGLLCGLFGIGALLAAYLSRTTDNKNQFRGNLCCIFMLENIFRLFAYLATGVFNRYIIYITIITFPAVILGLFIGMKADSRLNDNTIRIATICLLILSGAFLMIKNAILH